MRNILYSPLTAGILLLAVFFALHAAWNIFATYQQTKQSYEITNSEYESLKKHKENTQEKIEQLSTERGIEVEIRNKFGFVKEGEGVVIIAEPPPGLGDSVIEDGSKNTLDIE